MTESKPIHVHTGIAKEGVAPYARISEKEDGRIDVDAVVADRGDTPQYEAYLMLRTAYLAAEAAVRSSDSKADRIRPTITINGERLLARIEN